MLETLSRPWQLAGPDGAVIKKNCAEALEPDLGQKVIAKFVVGRIMLKGLLLPAMLCLLVNVVSAQSPERSTKLVGLRTAKINIQVLTQRGDCRPNEQTLKELFLLPIRAYTKIRIVEESEPADATLAVTVSTVVDRAYCAHNVMFSAWTFADVRLPFQNHNSSALVELWNLHGTIVDKPGDHERIKKMTENAGRDLATNWQEANL